MHRQSIRPVLHRLSAAHAANSRGMTLIEILVVLAIIGLIVGGVSVMATNVLGGAQVDTASKDIISYEGYVEVYKVQKKGKCPKGLSDLKAAGIVRRVNKDPWGNDYRFNCDGEHAAIEISSAGPDGNFDTDDDINSWSLGEAASEEAEE
ncbi:MAG: prepilin-type N-terminal cleavage/methylation domain-containing protein [Myxococcales bacterium FL481]|nr:MAG: prepilin-type N-terminal cleavage/methylation domain-containing protein [Myxococcales bacterium FL481]